MKRIFVVLALCAPLIGACDRPDTVRLTYRFEEGQTLDYRLQAEGFARWDIEGRTGDGSYDVTFDVRETVEAADADGAVVAVVMTPVDVVENDLLSPGSAERSFTLRLSDDGAVEEVIEVDGVPGDELDPAGVFIGTYRPPLPDEPKGLTDTWDAAQEVGAGLATPELATRGRLVGLGRDLDGELAEIAFSGSGALLLSTNIEARDARLSGEGRTRTHAVFDLDRGFLRSARSTIAGDFAVEIVDEQEAVGGTLTLELELELENLG